MTITFLHRKVMEKTPHNFLGFDGAMIFAKRLETPLLAPGALITEYAKEALDDWRESQKSGGAKFAKTEIGHRRHEVLDTKITL